MRTLIRALIVLTLFGLTAMFNVGLVDIRIQEIDYLLGKAAANQDVSNALGIVAKYELVKRRMEFGEEDVGNYEFEARMQALTSGDQHKDDEPTIVRKLYLAPIRATVNGIRLALGKELINTEEEDQIFNVLEIGYFWERTRKYPDAVKIYDEVLGMQNVSPDIRAAVLLHKAFCHSMMNEYQQSKRIYERVIDQYPNTDAGMLAWKLLDFLDSVEKKRESVRTQHLGDFDMAKQFYLLMDYRNAIKYFARFLRRNQSSHQTPEAVFFKGRSHEELGETQEAIDEYRHTIRIDTSKRWAKEANRRLLMLGEFYEQKKQMAEEARRQLAAYQDQGFMNNVERFTSMVSESSLKGELMKDTVEANLQQAVPDEAIMALINSIGDLTGQKEEEKRRRIEEERQRIIAERNLSQEAIRELDKKLALVQNPARQASFLRRVVSDNADQLKYIYNKRLRKGVPISGKMEVEIMIEADGGVSAVNILRSNMGDDQFENDVTAQIATWKFRPVPDSLGSYAMRFPFEFYEDK